MPLLFGLIPTNSVKALKDNSWLEEERGRGGREREEERRREGILKGWLVFQILKNTLTQWFDNLLFYRHGISIQHPCLTNSVKELKEAMVCHTNHLFICLHSSKHSQTVSKVI